MDDFAADLSKALRYAVDEKAAFEKAIDADPLDATTHLVYADWLDENGEPEEAAFRRSMGEWIKDRSGPDQYGLSLGQPHAVPHQFPFRFGDPPIGDFKVEVPTAYLPKWAHADDLDGRGWGGRRDIDADHSIGLSLNHMWRHYLNYRGMESGLRKAFQNARKSQSPPES